MLQVGRSRRLEGPGEKHLGGYRKEGVQRAAASKDCHHSRDDRDGSQPVRMSGAFDIKTTSLLGILGPGVQIATARLACERQGVPVPVPGGSLLQHTCATALRAGWAINGPTDAERADWSSCRRLTTAQGLLSRSVPWSLRIVDSG